VTPAPSVDPGSSAAPSPSPSAGSGGGAGPVGPIATTETGPGGGASSGGEGTAPAGPPLTSPFEVAGPPGGRVDLQRIDVGGTGLAIEWVVPTLVVTVPGILLMLAILAQGAGALMWLPYARRTLGADRRRRRAPARTRRKPA
jgi:hypothetical protein